MHQFQSLAPQAPTVTEYAFPNVLQYLQLEWRRFERDRNEWDIEKAEMKARIAFLEGEKRGVDNTKLDLMKRVKMLEYALRQERCKYVENHNNSSNRTKGASISGTRISHNGADSNAFSNGRTDIAMTQNRTSTYSIAGNSMAPVSPNSATNHDPAGRAKSREFLRICLQEISYLTSSVPQSIAMAIPPAQSRLSRHELNRRADVQNGVRGSGNKNRHSDFFPATGHASASAPAPLPRSNSVPLNTLQSLSKDKHTGTISSSDAMDAAASEDIVGEDVNASTLKQQRTHHPLLEYDRNITEDVSQRLTLGQVVDSEYSVTSKSMEQANTDFVQGDLQNSFPDGLQAFQQDEAVTAIHTPASREQWRVDLEIVGQQVAQISKGKKTHAVLEDEAQLACDLRLAFFYYSKWSGTKTRLNNKMMKFKDIRAANVTKKAVDELPGLGISESESKLAGADSNIKESDVTVDEPACWRPKVALKRHFDTIRSIAFHPVNKSLLSGSEDGTMKYWNLESSLRTLKRQVLCRECLGIASFGGRRGKPMNGEVEPTHTYRGHTKAITSVAISVEQNKCFSASMDSTVRSWKSVPMEKETYARIDPTLPLSSFIGHTDSVWDIRLFPLSISSSQLLASISADGALKIWNTETDSSPLRSSWGYYGLEPSKQTEPTGAYTSGLAKLPVPTSLDFCPTDLTKLVVSYSNSIIKLFDIETGKEILACRSNGSFDGTPATQINKIVCHPTMPIIVSGHEDRYIRFFDINTGGCSFSVLSHLDAVSSLDIDPSGLALCSGGHDGSVRVWDMASPTRSCLQEFTGHRRKSDEGVTTVKYHPTLLGLLATGGADAIIKIYTQN
ncbi:hypothetical protein BG011_008803 [Mortierella polycephala]|uniref:Striatin N-terminal domain-containing protein n=1 Tax=Mortierella polycephala TaxID=41804 RepID=A0A9P6TWT6_9FUNG|nr:hypothetical protein BG011_008803 [Mortierella polycephala]